MEVPRLWRNQESHYLAGGRKAFEITSSEKIVDDKTTVDYVVRTKLFNRRIKFCVNGEGSMEAAGKMVAGLKRSGYNDETIFKLAFEMGDTDPRLGMGFVQNVVCEMSDDKTPEGMEEKLVTLVSTVL
jgi:hypothetical protein